MCGIVGYIGPKPVVPVLLDGLRRLEYRGYDSAGVAVVQNGAIEVRRSAGKLINLENAIQGKPLAGVYGLGHTRWATHGRPTEENAHPHRDGSGRIVVVHNGIIENYLEIKRELIAEGHKFVSETDTEVVAHLVEKEWKNDGLENAVLRAMKRVRGLFALVLMSADDPEKLVAVRNGPPIVVGMGDGEYFVASDVPALLSHTRNVVFLDDREMAVLTNQRRVVHDDRRHSWSIASRRASRGIRSRRRRPATSTSCSRKSSSSRRPCAKPCSAAPRSRPGRCTSTRWRSPTPT